MSYLTLSSQGKHLFHSVHTFTRIRQHYTSLNIGEKNSWAVPTSNFWGTIPPVPLGLRPWKRGVSLLSEVRDLLRLNSLLEFNYNFNFDVKLLLLEGPL